MYYRTGQKAKSRNEDDDELFVPTNRYNNLRMWLQLTDEHDTISRAFDETEWSTLPSTVMLGPVPQHSVSAFSRFEVLSEEARVTYLDWLSRGRPRLTNEERKLLTTYHPVEKGKNVCLIKIIGSGMYLRQEALQQAASPNLCILTPLGAYHLERGTPAPPELKVRRNNILEDQPEPPRGPAKGTQRQ